MKPPKDESEKAGKWGDYRCDANPMVIDLLKHSFKKTGKPDLILWTGDNPDHGVYKDPTVSTNATIRITNLIKEYSPNSIIFPIHGNHEFDPMNIQDFNLEVDPVIDIVANSWKHWMPEEVNEEYKAQTFYSMKAVDHPNISKDFKKKMGKTRIIAYNSQDCYIYNFYIIGQMNDPKQQLEWLENLLRQMEKDGEVAIFISHMSPGTSDCLSEVSDRVRAIFDRFQHIIRLNLFGHTHNEEFEVIRAVEDGKPIGVNYLTSSMTTYTSRNPAFRVITLDAETKLPLRIETHVLNITEANKNDDDAIFKFDHELTEVYDLHDLSPSSFLDLANRFEDDLELVKVYKRNMFQGGPGFKPDWECDDSCKKLLSCRTSNSVFSEARDCLHWKDMKNVWVLESYLFDFMNGRWVEKK